VATSETERIPRQIADCTLASLLAPWIAHVLTDVVIAGIVLTFERAERNRTRDGGCVVGHIFRASCFTRNR
jgi:hypothetical protein